MFPLFDWNNNLTVLFSQDYDLIMAVNGGDIDKTKKIVIFRNNYINLKNNFNKRYEFWNK